MTLKLAPIGGGGGGGGVDPVRQTNVVRFAKGQPVLTDPGGEISSWSYDEDTGTLTATYANNLTGPLTPQTAPHFRWPLTGFDGVDIVQTAGDMHWWALPIVTDITYSGPTSDDPSVAIGFTNTVNPTAGQGVVAIWTPVGSNGGVSCATWTPPGSYSVTPLDSAPSLSTVGAVLLWSPRSVFGANGSWMETPRASGIGPAGDYDTGHEANFNGIYNYFTAAVYLDVWLGCAQYSGGTGTVTAGETITCTVAQMTRFSRGFLVLTL
jgi:hypothetical protein